MHLGFEQAGRRWLQSLHTHSLAGSDSSLGGISPYGYGGPVCDSDEPDFLRAAWQAHSRWCREHRVLAEFCRFHPEAANQSRSCAEVRFNRQTVSVDLLGVEPMRPYNEQARRKIRRAEAQGAQVRWSREATDLLSFAPFYRQAMTSMQAAPSYLFGDAYFEAMAGVPEVQLCIVELQGQWASAGLYLQGVQVIEYHLGASTPAGHAAGTAYLLQHAAALLGRSLGLRSLYLGGGTGTEEDNPLLFYKKSFSKRLLPFYTGQAIHDPDAYWSLAAQFGFDREHPPARLLFD